MSQPKVELKDLGLIDYKECWDYQTKIFEETVQQKISNRKFPATNAETQNYLLFWPRNCAWPKFDHILATRGQNKTCVAKIDVFPWPKFWPAR